MPDKKQTLEEKLVLSLPIVMDSVETGQDLLAELNSIIRIIVDHIDQLDREAVRVERKY